MSSNQASQRPNAWNNPARVNAWKVANTTTVNSTRSATTGNASAATGARDPQPVKTGGKVVPGRSAHNLSSPVGAVAATHVSEPISRAEISLTPPVTLANATSTTGTVITPRVTAIPLIAFISGPLEADSTYFQQHYVPHILSAIEAGHQFIIGPSRGIDSMALEFLLSYEPQAAGSSGNSSSRSNVASRITLYLNPQESRTPKLRYSPLIKKLERMGVNVTVVAHGSHTERDEAMTRDSHYDILRYRTEEECRVLYGPRYRRRVSGTEKNEIRRRNGVGLVVPGVPA